jgi:hypothetical protein
MTEGTQLVLTIGMLSPILAQACDVFVYVFTDIFLAGNACRAAAFVIPCVCDAFAAGLGGWIKRLLELIVCAMRESGDFNGEGQRVVQWWIFVNANFTSISKDLNALVAAARQWDVHGVVYESMFGSVKDMSMNAPGKNSLAAVAIATSSATVKLSASPTGASSTYLQYPQRHSFPTVSYQQRSRFSFARSESHLSTVR